MFFDPVQPRKILAFRSLSEDSFVLTIERRSLKFKAGHHIGVGLPGDEVRRYSIFSGEKDDALEILVRRVERGRVSAQLALLRPGDLVQVRPPKGGFMVGSVAPGTHLWLISTGTGIAPFRSFLRSHPELDYTLIHGVRTIQDDFGSTFADKNRRIVYVSRETVDPRTKSEIGAQIESGHVTQFVRTQPLPQRVYLCGNSAMIFEVTQILVERGFSPHDIATETYF